MLSSAREGGDFICWAFLTTGKTAAHSLYTNPWTVAAHSHDEEFDIVLKSEEKRYKGKLRRGHLYLLTKKQNTAANVSEQAKLTHFHGPL